MAFNPDVGGIPSPNMPDQTGASRGEEPNRAFEYLFEGLAKAGDATIQGIDNNIKDTIKKEATAGFEEVNKPYLDTIPTELKNAGSAIESLQAALEQGKISDTYYYGQLTSLAKSMRAKYPGYEDYVDAAIQEVTGVRPANAYRNALLQEMSDQQSAASDAEKFYRQWEKENEAFITVVAPDYFEDPSKYDRNAIRGAVAGYKGDKEKLNQQNLEIESLFNQEKLDDKRAEEAATNSLNLSVDYFMRGIVSTEGLNGEDFIKKIETAMSDNVVTSEEYAQLSNEFAQAKAILAQTLYSQVNSPLSEGSMNSYATILGPERVKAVIEAAMAPFAQLEDLITNEKMGLAGYSARMVAMDKNSELARVLNASPDAKTAFALSEIDPLLAQQFVNEAGKQEGIFKDIAPAASASVLNGADTLARQLDALVKAKGPNADKAGFINTYIENFKAAIASGKVSPEQFSSVVNNLYGIDSGGKTLFDIVSTTDYMTLYNRIYNDEVTNNIMKMGSEKDKKDYVEGMRERIFAVPDIENAITTFGSVNSQFRGIFEVKATADGKFTIVDKVDAKDYGRVTNEALAKAERDRLEKAVNAINNVLDTYGYAQELMSGGTLDKDTKLNLYKDILEEYKVRGALNLDQRTGVAEFVDWIGKSLNEFLMDDSTAEETFKDKRLSLGTQEIPEDTVSANVVDKIIGVESGGQRFAKNPNSSAYGPGQFLDSTWNIYAKKLGLTDRTDPEQARMATEAYAKDNAKILRNYDIPVNDQTIYAAHFLGGGGAVDVLTSDDTDQLVDILPARVIAANDFLRGMTVADFKDWLAQKMS